MGLYWTSAALGCVVALAVTPFVGRLAFRLGALDHPNHRTIHDEPIPRLGGVAIVFALVATVVGMAAFSPAARVAFTIGPWQVAGILAGLGAVFALGVVDDLYGLNAWHKFPVQIIAATIVYAVGFRVDVLSAPGDGAVSLGFVGYPITVLWIVGVTNAINLIDGLDGLAAGISAIASATICAIAVELGHVPLALATAALCGALVGFLRFNFYPAKLFMGDSGSLVLGFLLAVLSLQGAQKASTAVALFVPIVVMAVPIADTVTAVARRLVSGRGLFSADRDHFHHRLIWKGLDQRRAVGCLYAVSAACGVIAYAMTIGAPSVSWGLLTMVVVGGILLIRELDYAEFNGLVGRIVRGDRRRRPARYKNRIWAKARNRIASSEDVGSVWRTLTAAVKELEFDSLCVEPVMAGRSMMWRARGAVDGPPAPDLSLWTSDHLLASHGQSVRVTIGKYAWKMRRRTEDEERWGRELAEAFGAWLSTHSVMEPYSPIQPVAEIEFLSSENRSYRAATPVPMAEPTACDVDVEVAAAAVRFPV